MNEHENLTIAVLQQSVLRLTRQRRTLLIRRERCIYSQKKAIHKCRAEGDLENEAFHRGQLKAFTKMADWFEE